MKKIAIVLALVVLTVTGVSLFTAASGKPVAHACDQQPC